MLNHPCIGGTHSVGVQNTEQAIDNDCLHARVESSRKGGVHVGYSPVVPRGKAMARPSLKLTQSLILSMSEISCRGKVPYVFPAFILENRRDDCANEIIKSVQQH